MGLFDYVIVNCPTCGEDVEFQSKGAYSPRLNRYNLHSAPMEVLMDLADGCGSTEKCEGCGHLCSIVLEEVRTVQARVR